MTARTGMGGLITRLRPMVADKWQLRQDTANGDGSGSVYWLQYKPTSGGTVSVGGTVQGTASYTLNSTYGKLALTSAPASGVAVAVEYLSAQWTDDELEDALERYTTLIEDRLLDFVEENQEGTAVYHRAVCGYRDLEESTSGTVYWNVRDTGGTVVGTSNYTADYASGILRWSSDTGGTSYYLTARSYDINAAAADLWQEKAASIATQYDFAAGDQRFSRSQAVKQARDMARFYRERAGQNRGRGDAHFTSFLRTDLNATT